MVATPGSNRSVEVRSGLKHPVIDTDGHAALIGVGDSMLDYVKKVGGAKAADRMVNGPRDELTYMSGRSGSPWAEMTPEQRRDTGAYQPTWWILPTKNAIDRASAALPKLLHERMDELGFDISIVYEGFGMSHRQDDELRAVACRAFNMWQMDRYQGYLDRIIPSASIPMHTPDEAIAELEFAVNELGYKVVNIAGYVKRPLKEPTYGGLDFGLDFFGLDSEYDYDRVWAKCVELGVAPTSHAVGMGFGSRRSASNYMYNHIGHFAWSAEALCKALFFGGVTRRFPGLHFGFMECGVGWACNLYADLVARWEKRSRDRLRNIDPDTLDLEAMAELIERYRDDKVQGTSQEIIKSFVPHVTPKVLDDFHKCEIEDESDIKTLFEPSFYFGCEADDPMNAWAFNAKVNPFGARLRPVLSSDIGHWDVPDMTDVLAEAYEQVEKGLIDDDDFRDFSFANAVRLHGGMNPRFFEGTPVEAEAAKVLASEK